MLTFRQYDDDFGREALEREHIYSQPQKACSAYSEFESNTEPVSEVAVPVPAEPLIKEGLLAPVPERVNQNTMYCDPGFLASKDITLVKDDECNQLQVLVPMNRFKSMFGD